MPHVVEGEVRKEEDVAKASGELEDTTTKEAKASEKVVLIHRPLPPFP